MLAFRTTSFNPRFLAKFSRASISFFAHAAPQMIGFDKNACDKISLERPHPDNLAFINHYQQVAALGLTGDVVGRIQLAQVLDDCFGIISPVNAGQGVADQG